ncbi:porin PorA family protein, partial [Klebsiella pneumoniae]|uniref:porin PorA family protein n=1 Tax=Klebsiella pneumoniae TaxID=573 RepID=UPI0027309EE9
MSYPYFDTLARETYPIDFVETTQIDGTEVFHFSHTIDPMDTGGKLTLPASVWGLSGDPDAQVLMHRFYTAKRGVTNPGITS